eukprot:CAMPEP_0179895506 /NCGR_PEP_ID=MMETSP0982-20121206/35861_1 /TAXON_ID=483367 /ORGANISM="non described non described, Strain CCMP 2436" /LENGTH=73 /DNA_ID=CAMNT_0021792179 /DNA_START=88 /DNA_END=309 /DNA_ORIENTATION=+
MPRLFVPNAQRASPNNGEQPSAFLSQPTWYFAQSRRPGTEWKSKSRLQSVPACESNDFAPPGWLPEASSAEML